MFKLGISFILCTILIAVPVLSDIDTSPYTDLKEQISQLEKELEAENKQGPWQSVNVQLMINLTRKKDKLTDQLSTPRMQFLQLYSNIRPPLEEARYLSEQMGLVMGRPSTESGEELQNIEDSLSDTESLYDAKSYSQALSNLESLRYDISKLPAELASEASASIENLKGDLERNSQLTPSVISMLENADQKFQESKIKYTEASSRFLSGRYSSAEDSYDAGHEISEEAFRVVSRAKDFTGQMLDWVKLLLILGPVVMVVLLLVYFKLQFKKNSSIKSSLSQTKIKADKNLELERTIEFLNYEKKSVPLKIKEKLPSSLVASDFSMPPTETVGNELTWAFEAKPGRTKITYRLKSTEPIKKKRKIRIPGASVIYEVDGAQKKAVSSSQEVMAI
jgi:hypothetical protein